jgi:glyoxylase-like metal-dependent hydrolase (beta-lactamase superfamily II)
MTSMRKCWAFVYSGSLRLLLSQARSLKQAGNSTVPSAAMDLPGFHIFRIPLPLPVDNMNVYFMEKPVPTLIDVPPNDNTFKSYLETALAEINYRIKDIRRIIVTHPHFDHFGLARWIADQGDAEIWIHADAVGHLETHPKELAFDVRYYNRFLRLCGAPSTVKEHLQAFYHLASNFGCQVRVSKALRDGDEVSLAGVMFKVMSVPGHTPYCILIHNAETGLAFTGDFLIQDITSNALVQRPRRGLKEYKGLITYISSLIKVRDMGLKLALSGHGEVIKDPTARIVKILSFIENRQKKILRILGPVPTTVFHIMDKLLPHLPPNQILLGLSEVLGYLELLEQKGLVTRTNDRELLSFFCD